LNPGPHGPELCDLSSRNVGNDRFQFEISDPASLLVQNWVSLRPNYYMKYYRPGAGESLAAPSLPLIADQPNRRAGQPVAQDIDDKKTRARSPHSRRF